MSGKVSRYDWQGVVVLKKNLCLTLVFIVLVFSKALSAKQISVMSYNVENFFDDQNDKGKNDENFLPLKQKMLEGLCEKQYPEWRKKECERLDWNAKVVLDKMRQLASVIMSVQADIVVLQEVENLEILKTLNNKFLSGAGFVTVELLEGPDVRGIDIGVLSKYKLAGTSKLHPVEWKKASPAPERPTRSVLEVSLYIGDGEKASVFGVHFPSPSHTIEERMDAFDTLRRAASRSSSDLIVAAGDFNVTANEDSRLYRAYASDIWDVSHHFGCKKCLGTNYYKPYGRKNARDSWSFLDAITVHKNSKYRFVPSSIDVVNKFKGIAVGALKKPARFIPETGEGFSDHFPVIATLRK